MMVLQSKAIAFRLARTDGTNWLFPFCLVLLAFVYPALALS